MKRTGRPPKAEWAICKMPDCGQSTKEGAKGFCASHYSQFRNGLIDESGTETGKRQRCFHKGTPCLHDGCDSPAVGRGLCAKHYQQEQRKKRSLTPRFPGPACRLCERAARVRGLCSAHYAQWQKGIIDVDGSPLREMKRVARIGSEEVCRQPGCDKPVKSLGWCNAHYLQFRAGILDKEGNQLRELKPNGRRPLDFRKEVAGYILVRAPEGHPGARHDGSIYEHRLVMEEHLGRYLDPEEVVHHISGARDDNRIENLQLRRSRSDHGHGHEGVEDVDGALVVLERLVNKGMTNSSGYRKRLRKIAQRLRPRKE